MACLPAQVDMFSYGMVLYELLSGQRPALGHHQLQIAKKLSKGIRPVLGQPEEVQFHRLQALMMECWDTKPEKVPGGAEPGAWPLQPLGPKVHPAQRVSNTKGNSFPLACPRKKYLPLLIHPDHFPRTHVTTVTNERPFLPRFLYCIVTQAKHTSPFVARQSPCRGGGPSCVSVK